MKIVKNKSKKPCSYTAGEPNPVCARGQRGFFRRHNTEAKRPRVIKEEEIRVFQVTYTRWWYENTFNENICHYSHANTARKASYRQS